MNCDHKAEYRTTTASTFSVLKVDSTNGTEALWSCWAGFSCHPRPGFPPEIKLRGVKINKFKIY
jgi:hypothetical protein